MINRALTPLAFIFIFSQQIRVIAETGVKVVVAGGKIGDMALHFLNKYNLMAVRLTSKWDLRRVARLIRATVLPRLVSSKFKITKCLDIRF